MIAARAATTDFPDGFGKAEDIAGFIIISGSIKLIKQSAGKLLGKNCGELNADITRTVASCGFADVEVKTYTAGKNITAAVTVTGDGDEKKAGILIKEKTGADLFLKRR